MLYNYENRSCLTCQRARWLRCAGWLLKLKRAPDDKGQLLKLIGQRCFDKCQTITRYFLIRAKKSCIEVLSVQNFSSLRFLSTAFININSRRFHCKYHCRIYRLRMLTEQASRACVGCGRTITSSEEVKVVPLCRCVLYG